MTFEERAYKLGLHPGPLKQDELLNTLTDEEKEKLQECLNYIKELTEADSVGVILKSISVNGRCDYVIELNNSKGW